MQLKEDKPFRFIYILHNANANVLLFHINMQLLPWNLLSSLHQQFLVSYTSCSSRKKMHSLSFTVKKPHTKINCSSWQPQVSIKQHKLRNYTFDDWRSELNPSILSHFCAVFSRSSNKLHPKRDWGRMKQDESTLVHFQESEKY